MPGLSTDLVVHKLPTDPAFPPVKQKLRKFKTDMSVKIKEEVTKQKQFDHVRDLRKFFQRLCRYNLKLNLAKCAFVVPSGKLLGFIVSRRGIELDPSKIKAIQELPPPRNKTGVMSVLGRLNYIIRFITQLTTTCEPIFKLLKKDVAVKGTDECQEAFDKIKGYLSNPPVLVLPELGRPLILYLTVLDNSFGCVLEFDIVYVRTVMKSQALAENPMDEEYEPLRTYFPDEEIQGEWEIRDLKLMPYQQCLHDLCQRFRSVEFRNIPRIHNKVDDALTTLASMLHHPDKAYVDPLHIQFKITHRNSTPYLPKANGAFEASNMNIKKILRKMVEGSRQWHEKLPFALLVYRTTVCTSVGVTLYLLVYGTEAVIPPEVEILSLKIVAEAKSYDDEWVKARVEQLSLIDKKRLAAVCHGQLYQK
ncbi:uncharacterized protein [Nicotiana sylvestris]|uniref:uncharacterized protein n=1 Tax=Nicotiana sylvestris TaxID=4096 RepID=UPI00388C8C43